MNKLLYENVKTFIETESNCKLLSTEYVDNAHKLKLQCICGNVFETTLASFKEANKRSCDTCGDEHCASKKRFSQEFVEKELLAKGFLPINLNYKNANTKISI
jgi:hypothetical protein